MYSHSLKEIDQNTPKATIVHWFLLCFLAGNVNAGGYLACGRFVSHVTGFATLFGMEAAHGRWDGALGILTVPIFFLLGVMISAYFVDKRNSEGKRPQYALVMAMIALCLVTAALAGYLNWFGDFATDYRLKTDYLLLALLCMASGLQNAAITASSGHTVRTTHLTGLTTDLGLGLIRAFGASDPKQRALEKITTQIRFGMISSFAVGSAAGAWLFIRFQYLGFLGPAALAAYFTALATLEKPLTAAN